MTRGEDTMAAGAETEEHPPGEGDHGAETGQGAPEELLIRNLGHLEEPGLPPHLVMMTEPAENTLLLPRWRTSSGTN